MQFADLMRLFREGQNEGRKRGYVTQGACDAEGITAVIRALRDEIDAVWTSYYMGYGTILDVFNQIPGIAAGEKVAGSTPEGAVLSSSAEGEPPASPATDPAPAVCEWEPDNFGRMQHWHPSCAPRVLAAGPDGRGCCYICGKPIKFTEAK